LNTPGVGREFCIGGQFRVRSVCTERSKGGEKGRILS
jgi:hypothetical protein